MTYSPINRSQTLTSPSVRAKKRMVKPIKSRSFIKCLRFDFSVCSCPSIRGQEEREICKESVKKFSYDIETVSLNQPGRHYADKNESVMAAYKEITMLIRQILLKRGINVGAANISDNHEIMPA